MLAALGQKRSAVKSLLKFGSIAVNETIVAQFDHPLVAGDIVTVGDLKSTVAVSRLKTARIEILFEDEALLAVNKPEGLLTVANDRQKTDTLFFRLKEFLHARDDDREARPEVVHRIDKETSGVVLFAKSEKIKRELQAGWPHVTKTYFAIVEGVPDPPEETITSYLSEHPKSLLVLSRPLESPGAKLSTTHYRVLQTRNELSLLEVRIDTGRKHQIRVHMAGLEHPVAGDKRYGSEINPCKRLALHACRLTLTHPVTKTPLELNSPMPRELAKLFPKFGTSTES